MKQGGLFFVLATILFGSFFISQSVDSASSQMVITEVGAYESSGYEWVEIYNRGQADVDLTGWKFIENNTNHGMTRYGSDVFHVPAGTYAIIAQDAEKLVEKYPLLGDAIIFDSAWGSLKESGEEIGLRNGEDVVQEIFIYSEAKEGSLQRIDVHKDTYTEENWVHIPDTNTIGSVYVAEDQEEEAPVIEEVAEEEEVAQLEETFCCIQLHELFIHPNEGELEWIELYNTTSTAISLGGWQVLDAVGIIAQPTSTIASGEFFVIPLQKAKLNNGGDIVQLVSPDGEVIDMIAYGTEQTAAPGKGNALARIDSTWGVTNTPTAGTENIAAVIVEEQALIDDQDPVATPSQPADKTPIAEILYTEGDVVINELVSDPADGEEEFVELYNTTDKMINITGWWIENGSEKEQVLEGVLLPHEWLLISKPKVSLNNAGDYIALWASENLLIDEVTYGSWDDGNVGDNAPKAKDPYSIGRRVDGEDTDIDSRDFVVMTMPTKGEKNMFKNDEEEATRGSHAQSYTNHIVIRQVFPNPKGSDKEDEFIEIYNGGDVPVALGGWKIGDGSKKRYIIPEETLPAQSARIFLRKETGIALNNSGEERVTLYTPEDVVITQVHYSGKVAEDSTYVRLSDNTYVWQASEVVLDKTGDIVAPPEIVVEAPHNAVVGEVVFFDASDSQHPVYPISTTWIVDGVTTTADFFSHTFYVPGKYPIDIIVATINGLATSTQSFFVDVFDTSTIDRNTPATEYLVQINEVFPNPSGPDIGEYIELYNPTAMPLSLEGLAIDDGEKGSKPYVFTAADVIPAEGYFVVAKEDSNITLNNTTDAVRILNRKQEVVQEVYYDDAKEDASLVATEQGVWIWQDILTPGLKNVIVMPEAGDHDDTGAEPVVPEVLLGELSDIDIGTVVKTRGIVAVPAGVLGSQYFYIVDTSAQTGEVAAGVQVYMYKKLFPPMHVGDRVEIVGEVSKSSMGPRVKIKEKTDITVIGKTDVVPQGVQKELEFVSLDDVGKIITVQGEITEAKTSHAYIDDGTDEIKVYIKKGTDIPKKALKLGQTGTITGVLVQTKNGLQLLVRGISDINLVAPASDTVTLVSQETAKDDEVAKGYLTATAGGVTSILFGLFVKGYGQKLIQLLVGVFKKTVA